MSGEIVVVAVGEVQAPVLAHLCAALARTFGQPCRVGTALPMPEHAFDPRRAQYSAQAILQQLLSGRAERVLGVVDRDLYVPGLNFVFGLAGWREKRAVIALPRLGQRFYGARDDKALFLTLCHRTSPTVSRTIGLCGDCLRAHWPAVRPHVDAVQADSRAEFDLPVRPPRHLEGIRCVLCCNECVMGEDERGYCGLRTVRSGKLVHLAGTPERGLLYWYRDLLPTNCVADWVCEGSQHMSDLPCTSARHAEEAQAAARGAGLVNVRVGNRHLLG